MRQFSEASPRQLSRHSLAHLAFKPDFDSSIAVKLFMPGIDGRHRMRQLIGEDAERFDGISDIGADKEIVVSVLGRRAMPALPDTICRATVNGKPMEKRMLCGNGKSILLKSGRSSFVAEPRQLSRVLYEFAGAEGAFINSTKTTFRSFKRYHEIADNCLIIITRSI